MNEFPVRRWGWLGVGATKIMEYCLCFGDVTFSLRGHLVRRLGPEASGRLHHPRRDGGGGGGGIPGRHGDVCIP